MLPIWLGAVIQKPSAIQKPSGRDWKEGGSEVGALLPGGSYGCGEFVWLWVGDRRAVVGVGVAAAAGARVCAV